MGCEDYGSKFATDLQMAPEGFDSVCGTERDQKVPPVQLFAKRGDPMAKTLLKHGHVYGRQFSVYLSCQAYPAYVVYYTCPKDFDSIPERPRTETPLRWEHRAPNQEEWTAYPPKHVAQLTQALGTKVSFVILEHEADF